MKRLFREKISDTLTLRFGELSEDMFTSSPLLQYLFEKTKSANSGSKARGSFGNLYALYVLIEDYVEKGFHINKRYSKYEGAKFSNLLQKQRELPFGSKLQNHSLNHRVNQEFHKFFPTCEFVPIIRNTDSNRYWINENLLKVKLGRKSFNIAESVIEIINSYINEKKSSFNLFIDTCEKLKNISEKDAEEVFRFINRLIAPTSDARIFEIVSFSILKYYYIDQKIYIGFTKNTVAEENLLLFKTGRTNANDGGIDFVMKPLGRFFQVTESTDFKKYFLDIDKLERFPITFVIKSELPASKLLDHIKEGAFKQYPIESVVAKYMNCIEEIINLTKLKEHLKLVVKQGNLEKILKEVIKQSRVEFDYDE